MKNLTIKIPELGNFEGSPKWVAEKLEFINNSLKVGEYNGYPALFYSDFRRNNATTLLCYVCNNIHEQDFSYMPRHNDRILSIVASDFEDMCKGIFKYLTPKSQEIVTEYLDKITAEFLKRVDEKA